jgi:hypothetical protein
VSPVSSINEIRDSGVPPFVTGSPNRVTRWGCGRLGGDEPEGKLKKNIQPQKKQRPTQPNRTHLASYVTHTSAYTYRESTGGTSRADLAGVPGRTATKREPVPKTPGSGTHVHRILALVGHPLGRPDAPGDSQAREGLDRTGAISVPVDDGAELHGWLIVLCGELRRDEQPSSPQANQLTSKSSSHSGTVAAWASAALSFCPFERRFGAPMIWRRESG